MTNPYLGRFLACLSIILFLISFSLPAFTIINEAGKPEEIHGILAAIFGVIFVVLDSKTMGACLLLLGVWAANPLYVLLIVLRFTRNEVAPQLSWLPSVLAFLFFFFGSIYEWRIGYLIWLCSIMLMSYACQVPDPVKVKKDAPVIRDVRNKQKVKALPFVDIRGMKRTRKGTYDK